MQHRFVQTAVVGLLVILTQTFSMIPTGCSLMSMSTSALFSNEGRESLGKRVAAAPAVDPERTGQHQGRMVTLSGPLQPVQAVSDAVFFPEEEFVSVIRQVEMFAWQEHEYQKSSRRWGGSRQVDTITEYRLGWTDTPLPPRWMKHPEGHENPDMPWSTRIFAAESLRIGSWSLSGAEAMVLDGRPLEAEEVRWSAEGERLQAGEDGWFYLDRADAQEPTLGDVRLRFVVVPKGREVTAVGMASEGSLRPVNWGGGIGFVAVVPGPRDVALALFHGVDKLLLWGVRIGGIVGIFMGLVILTGPFFALLDIVPPVGMAARVVAFPVGILSASAWGVLVIGFSQVIRSTGFLIILGALAIGVLLAWWGHRRSR